MPTVIQLELIQLLVWLIYSLFGTQGLALELDDDIVADESDREALQDIVNNAKLSEGYLTLARDIEVMEPKSPEDIYKVLILVQLPNCFQAA